MAVAGHHRTPTRRIHGFRPATPCYRWCQYPILEVLRLGFESQLTHERIAAATRRPKGTVTNELSRAKSARIGWPLPEPIDDAQL
jgi:hypothetical protein